MERAVPECDERYMVGVVGSVSARLLSLKALGAGCNPVRGYDFDGIFSCAYNGAGKW